MKKDIPIHRKEDKRVVWQAARMEGAVRNVGITPTKKSKKSAA